MAVELLRHLFVSPLKAGAIYPEAVKENGNLARHTATFAFFMPIRFDRRTPHAFSVDHFFVGA
ncbi:hypothetical protein NKH47_26050 [Mesorhizobium sp. M1060]|uniref:hypothetical protein n=1 Tax=Mesorhizobium sp. M1060 TaxID=2957052 RepID=UPI003338BA11